MANFQLPMSDKQMNDKQKPKRNAVVIWTKKDKAGNETAFADIDLNFQTKEEDKNVEK